MLRNYIGGGAMIILGLDLLQIGFTTNSNPVLLLSLMVNAVAVTLLILAWRKA